MEPGLQSLLLCTDDTIVRVMRRVLSELEIGVEQCSDLDTTVQKMSRRRFEALIVDCTRQELPSKVLKGIRNHSFKPPAAHFLDCRGQIRTLLDANLKQ